MPNYNSTSRTPFAKGGSAGLKDSGRTGFDKGQRVEAEKRAKKGYKHKGTLKEEYKKIVGKDRDLSSPEKALFALQPMDVGYRFRKGLKEKGYKTKKIEEDILKEKMKTKEFRIGHAKSKVAGKKVSEDDQEYKVYKKGGKA